jgi:hypothetical protein
MREISVVVPLYNKAAYIGRCLDSILAQSFKDFEVIVVNDGSSDGGEARAQEFAARDSRVRLITQANAGPGAARNFGARVAASPLVAFLDADDAWEPDYLRESVSAMEWLGSEIASLTWGMRLLPKGETTERSWQRLGIPQGRFHVTENTPAGIIIALLANMLPSSTVMRKSVFEEMGGYYEKNRCLYSEDAYLYLKTLLRHPVAFDHRPLVIRHEDASELALNRSKVRPVEPFLTDPEDLERSCPESLRPLLHRVLARRALKTASVYGYWGLSREARGLVRRFVSAQDWSSPYFLTAAIGCTPLGGWIGRLARAGLRWKG